MSNKEEYISGMKRLLEVMPRNKLKKLLVKWLNQELTISEKLFEVRLLLSVWDE